MDKNTLRNLELKICKSVGKGGILESIQSKSSLFNFQDHFSEH